MLESRKLLDRGRFTSRALVSRSTVDVLAGGLKAELLPHLQLDDIDDIDVTSSVVLPDWP